MIICWFFYLRCNLDNLLIFVFYLVFSSLICYFCPNYIFIWSWKWRACLFDLNVKIYNMFAFFNSTFRVSLSQVFLLSKRCIELSFDFNWYIPSFGIYFQLVSIYWYELQLLSYPCHINMHISMRERALCDEFTNLFGPNEFGDQIVLE